MANLPDTQELLNTGLSADKPFLGDPLVVEGLVRDLMRQVTDARVAQHEGRLDDITAPLRAAAAQFQRVFYGADEAYLASIWNSPQHLGRALVNGAGIGGSAADAVERVASRILADVASALVKYEAGEVNDDGWVEFCDQMAELYTTALLGLPVNQGDDEEAPEGAPAPG